MGGLPAATRTAATNPGSRMMRAGSADGGAPRVRASSRSMRVSAVNPTRWTMEDANDGGANAREQRTRAGIRVVGRGGGSRTKTNAVSDGLDARSGRGSASADGMSKVGAVKLDALLAELPALKASVGGVGGEHERAYFELYRNLVRVGRLHDAVDLMKVMRDAGVENMAARVSHRDFFAACRSRRVVSAGFEFVELLQSRDIRPYNMLLRACATAGDARAASAAFKLMEQAGFEADVTAYTTLISACSKAGDVDRAVEAFGRLKGEGLEPNALTYSAMIDTFKRSISFSISGSKVKMVDVDATRALLARCFDMYEEMVGKKIEPDTTLMNSLLNACSRTSAVKKLRHEALEKSVRVRNDMIERGIELDSYSYSSLMHCAAMDGNYVDVLELFDDMKTREIPPTTEVYTVLIKAYGAMGNSEKAKKTWLDMRAEGIVGDAMCYASIMHIAALDRDEDFCDELMADMRHTRVRPSPQLYATLTGVAAREGNADKVEEIIQAAKKRGIRVPIECFNSLIAAHARADRPDLAIKAAEKLESAGFEPDCVSYEGLVMAFAWARDVEEAERMFERLEESGLRPTLPTLNTLMATYARVGQMEKALAMVETIENYGYEPDVLTWRELLSGAARLGDIDLAWQVYKDSRVGDAPGHEVALNTIIGLTLARIRSLTDPNARSRQQPRELGAFDDSEGQRSQHQEWSERAVAAYREATLAGVKPRVETLSTMLCCLRPPSTESLFATDLSESARAVSHETSSHEDAHKYYPVQALIMYEEAQSMGVVPPFASEAEEFVYDIRDFPPAAAEVMILTWLRVVRRRTDAHGLNTPIPSMILRVRSDDEVSEILKQNGSQPIDSALNRLTRTGERVLVLLRRLRINYAGSLENGTLELSGHAIGRWIQGFVPSAHGPDGSVFGETSLSGGLKSQAMRIRSNAFDDDDEDVWTPSKMKRPAFNINDYYGDDDSSDFGARPYYPKNWVQSSAYMSTYDEDDDMTDLERILEGRK